jgi:hypothetical protein
MNHTDTELRQMWEGATTEADKARVIHLWNDLLARKRKGELTDRPRVEAVKAAVVEAAVWHDRVTVTEAEGHKDGQYVARHWYVRMAYAGDPAAFDAARWGKLVTKVREAIGGMEGVDLGETDDYAPPEPPPGATSGRWASWAVDVQGWDGPADLGRGPRHPDDYGTDWRR